MGLELVEASPAALAAGNNNNYAGIGNSSFARLSADAAGSTLTGVAAPTGNKVLVIVNVSANTLTISNQDANSTAANRFLTASGANLTLNQDDAATFVYDVSTARWRQIAAVAA